MTEITKKCYNYATYYAELFSTPCIVMDTEAMTLETILQETKSVSQASYKTKYGSEKDSRDTTFKNFCAYCNHCNIIHTHLLEAMKRLDGMVNMFIIVSLGLFLLPLQFQDRKEL